MKAITRVLDYLGKFYCDADGVTYYHFKARGMVESSALIRIPSRFLGLDLDLKEGSIVMLQLIDFTWVRGIGGE